MSVQGEARQVAKRLRREGVSGWVGVGFRFPALYALSLWCGQNGHTTLSGLIYGVGTEAAADLLESTPSWAWAQATRTAEPGEGGKL